jgi:colanic acid biosynthesis glycosyl transferase WcaI
MTSGPSQVAERGLPADSGAGRTTKPKALVLYHYLYPDDVVSARHFGDFCQSLARRGWQVEARPSNRGCRDEAKKYPRRSEWQGTTIRRVWRPKFKQASALGRLLNAGWMIGAWGSLVLRGKKTRPDVVVVGSDPVLSVLVALVVRKVRPRIGIAHWCFDLYPEAATADGILRQGSSWVRIMKTFLRSAYGCCDVVADLGPCMRRLLDFYGHGGRQLTLVPWALHEPAHPAEIDTGTRRELFGDANLGLLYSGSFGRAHSHEEFLDLARALRSSGVGFCFAARGNRVADLRDAVTPDDTNVRFADFVEESVLPGRLGAADIHLVSLRPNWTGTVVPSKFVASLAVGRPVVFAGSQESSIAGWIRDHGVGWVLDGTSTQGVAGELQELAGSRERLADLQRHCHQVYQEFFCREKTMDTWDQELRSLLEPTKC